MKLYIHTLGCKVNQYESQAISELFSSHGYTPASRPAEADVIIVNSCTVTAESARKTRQTVRRMRKIAPEAVIILTGCMTESFPKDAEALIEADIVCGNTDYTEIFDIFSKHIASKSERTVVIRPHTKDEKYICPSISRFDERTRAYIKIEDGCNRFCSYCIIPYARGRVRSRAPEDIQSEAARLAENGYTELVLVGINLTAYGSDIGVTLKDAVAAAASPDGIKRIRLGSMELDQIDDETLDKLAACEKFCPQFHLSLQSGCDTTLKRMNRHYDTAYYTDFVNKIRSKFRNPSITTDIMVGFSGETEEDFKESVEYAKHIGFARIHTFAYSRREGTRAYAFDGIVPNAEKERRSEIMIHTAEKLEADFCASQIGRTEFVLFEAEENGMWYGYTPNYTRVAVCSREKLGGRILPVLLTEVSGNVCIGKLDINAE